MKLNRKSIEDKQIWEKQGYILPKFDIDKMIKETKNAPEWIHFGAGNLFRAFPAVVCQTLLNKGVMTKGVVVAEGYDYEIIDKGFVDFDNLHLAVTLKADGTIKKEVIASVAESLRVDTGNAADWNRLKEIFVCSSLKVVSFTITEKGYNLRTPDGEFLKDVAEDFSNTPNNAKSYIGKLVALCYERFKNGKFPLTLSSWDNCSHNGTKLYEAVTTFAENWVKNDKVEIEFLSYLKENISYPWSMIDKITPRPADSVIDILKKDGFENTEYAITSKNTYTAPFVNAEEVEYLVIEDNFLNGKIDLDKGGIIYTDKEVVDKVEKMKVCTCLNPLHTCLAIYGCLLGYEKISDEMKDTELVSLIKNVGYVEGLPVVVNPGIINPKEFIDEVINVRFPNPFMPDTPQRIACDTSQKLGIRFGETIKAYDELSSLNAKDLKLIPLVIAGWLRYLIGVNDDGEKFELSPDPLLAYLKEYIDKIKFSNNDNVETSLKSILENKDIFGINLYEVGLGEKIIGYFKELNSGKGSIRETLKKYC